ncbi:CDP-glycerol glycerophosphotransferase family protein [Enterococcus faecalis]|uniref:CDP-glycerol glycerophosphotransferase family protein n=1 Tax=Enterococcus TaxID=1350 RepID=UPI00094EC41F|nr:MULTISPECIES: CDP-glycerol glycerophosphotransferase family protein [Enterococcus]EGO6568250.1 CDP-glycerol glycerophosphotransferase family protein [Enterococcus faecalis]EGO6689551.1 CDP-glycerol glycerophosphotransferase family protein [Enterococcus faecalis]EGO7755194.1 CDP-glycerol glycerophosphotransferase family protein [Enterococcus faecalis]EGO7933785.1 CDP-glycerol glycerophosphotransferase family protein [Enterococcus faecalis]EGO8279317.1 CDP-glycerol glycerophosphotransferase f
MKKFLENSIHQAIKACFFFLGKLPKKKLFIFESFHGKQYSDNPRAIFEYIRDNCPEYQCIWAVKKGYEMPFVEENVPFVKRLSWRWLWLMPRAQYWVFNTRMPAWMYKNQTTIYIQTWHGTPLKKLGLDIETVKMPEHETESYKLEVIQEAKRWDYLISPNAYSTRVFRQAFNYEGEILEIGYPRNDLLVCENKDKIAFSVRNQLGLSVNQKIILYAPTWRDDESIRKGAYRFTNHLPVEQLLAIDSSVVILTRLHYLIAESFDISAFGSRVIDVSSYPDINQLYLIADLLITDYSSVMFDFALTKKPMLFFMYDKEKYQNSTRGFYFDPTAILPGKIVTDTDSLVTSVKNVLFSKTEQEQRLYVQFFREFCLENQDATRQLISEILKR